MGLAGIGAPIHEREFVAIVTDDTPRSVPVPGHSNIRKSAASKRSGRFRYSRCYARGRVPSDGPWAHAVSHWRRAFGFNTLLQNDEPGYDTAGDSGNHPPLKS